LTASRVVYAARRLNGLALYVALHGDLQPRPVGDLERERSQPHLVHHPIALLVAVRVHQLMGDHLTTRI